MTQTNTIASQLQACLPSARTALTVTTAALTVATAIYNHEAISQFLGFSSNEFPQITHVPSTAIGFPQCPANDTPNLYTAISIVRSLLS